MTVKELIKELSSLENYEEAEIKICMYNGSFTGIDSIEWNPEENCYTIYCIGEEIDGESC